MMRSNNVLQMTDTRRLSPQTTSSSGYHSDLSSSLTNQSPESIHDNSEQSSSLIQPPEKKFNKSFTRLSNFLHKQYEKVKLKLVSSKQTSTSTIATCSKATSTTPICYPLENNQPKIQSCIYKRSSFIEPVKKKNISIFIYMNNRLLI